MQEVTSCIVFIVNQSLLLIIVIGFTTFRTLQVCTFVKLKGCAMVLLSSCSKQYLRC